MRVIRLLITVLKLLAPLILLSECGPIRAGITEPPGPGWTLIFSDEFTGEQINPTNWNTQYWFGRTNRDNHELEWYEDDEVIVHNGILRLKAERKNVQGFSFASGMISSHDKVAFTYGYVEVRVRVPKGKGLWPAFWLLPSAKMWPPEIDVFEIVSSQTNKVLFTLHYRDIARSIKSAEASWIGPDFAANWHTFAIDWEPDFITWYVDGVARFRYVGPGIPHEPMYVIANLAVGGIWAGSPDTSTRFPGYFDIDYIRIWQR